MKVLDDLDRINALDSQDVLGAVEAFGAQCRDGWDIGRSAVNLPMPDGVDSVVVLGMGGSGISGDVVSTVLEPRLPLPIRVVKGYGPLPEWVGRNSLVFAVSYSGNTEETLAALDGAHERGARIVAISSGGDLAARADEYGVAHIAIPPGRQPRASLGYLTMPILATLQTMELAPSLEDDVAEAADVLDDIAARCDRKVPVEANLAKELAARIFERLPIVYGGHGLGAVAAQRFKCDLNEYGKIPAFWNELPELDHNEIVGWSELPAGAPFTLVLLRDADEHERIALRFEVTRRLIEAKFADVIEVHAEGRSRLARLLSLVLVTQLAAIYVAFTHDVDPGPVEVIESLKQELARN